MTSLLANKDRYIENFADSVYTEFLRIRYGIQSCRPVRKLYLDELRKDILDYHETGDGFVCPGNCSCSRCSTSKCYVPNCSYDSTCSVNNIYNTINNTFGASFVWVQAFESRVWTIRHNLGYVPNVFAEDENSVDIVGVVGVVDNDTIVITFNNLVKGTAYLS
jgi:hypothetical protein